jgi:DNA-binding PadR family transcriptional regulator
LTQGTETGRRPALLKLLERYGRMGVEVMKVRLKVSVCDRVMVLTAIAWAGKVSRAGLPHIVGRYIVARVVRASASMSSASYFILAALLDGPLHGYGIIKQAAELSDGRVRLAAGTLYGALDRLAEEGLILASGQEVVAGRTRRYYRLTDHGVQALHREAARMEQAARVVTRRPGSAAITPRLA